MTNREPEPHEQARYDQDRAAVDELIALARRHRLGYCVYPNLTCIGDTLPDYLESLSAHDVLVIAVSCIARLADLPAPPTVLEGIGT